MQIASTTPSRSNSPLTVGSAPFVRQSYPCSDDRYIAGFIAPAASPDTSPLFKNVYDALLAQPGDRNASRRRAMTLLKRSLVACADTSDDLPDTPSELLAWMEQSAKKATDAYQLYLAGRKAGEPRRFFTNRAHALHFLQAVAPTKLVDGAWLYGTLRHKNDPRMLGLVQTYLEELGNGDRTKNHVLLFRELLHSHGLSEGGHLPDECFEQGAIQLALGVTTEEMLPEVIGFNLGYEQLPLHLLITAYELNELGIDPYYFTLHVTVDNADSGHARKAVDAVAQNMSRYSDPEAYWQRIRRGYRLNDLGLGTGALIRSFSIDDELLRIFSAKSVAGAGAHSDYCRIEGRTVNEWLTYPAAMRDFVQALERKGWLIPGSDPKKSRFWQLLVGDRAEMFGVFSDYELQVIFDWIRGAASADGLKFDTPIPEAPQRSPRVLSFRAAQRQADRLVVSTGCTPRLAVGKVEREQTFDQASLSPALHWTPSGLVATRQVVAELLAA